MPDETEWCSKANLDYAYEICRSGHYDAIVYQDSYVPTHRIVCKLSKEYQIPLYVFEHNTPLYKKISRKAVVHTNYIKYFIRRFLIYPIEDLLVRNRKKLLLKYCTKYILLSDSFIPAIDIVLGSTNYTGRSKIISIPNPVKILEEPYPIKEKMVLYVGRLEPVKRVDMMLDIWAMIEKKYPDWHLSIVGDGSELDNLKKKTELLGLKHISFEGYSDPKLFYKKASIFWMTSLYEGWGLTLIEAMQSYCVPIAMDSYSSVHDIIEDNKTGLIVSNGDLNQFMIKTSELIDNETLLKEFAQNAWRSIRKFDVSIVIEKWKTLLNSRHQ